LPISRYDIADFLALSVETVSRSLTGLKERGVIAFATTRDIKIVNRDFLEEDADILGLVSRRNEASSLALV
jgi:CRP/FNR family nitrogen fixation transcriptional regulator